MRQTISFTIVLLILFAECMAGIGEVYGQPNFMFENTPAVQPTDAWKYIKYGDIKANLYTGTLNLSISAYIYKDKDFTIPIAFDYSTNGFVCNKRAGILGPDWVLNAGGCITIDIKGLPDFEVSNSTVGYNIYPEGFMRKNSENHTRSADITYKTLDTIMSYQPYGNMLQGHIFYQFSLVTNPAYMDGSAIRGDGYTYSSRSSIVVPETISIDNGPVIYLNYINLPQGQRDKNWFGSATIQELSNTYRLKSIIVKNGSDTLRHCDMSYTKYGSYNFLNKISIDGEGDYSMDYYNPSFCPPIGTLSSDHWGYYNGKNNSNSNTVPYLNITTIDANGDETIINTSRNPDISFAKCGMLSKITYPTGGYTVFEYEGHDYSKAVKRLSADDFYPKLYPSTGYCGGLRLKSFKNYRAYGELADSRTYEYKDGNASSGTLLYMPRYKMAYSASLQGTTYYEQDMTYFSSGIEAYNYTPIEYGKVTEKRNDGSKTVYTYSNAAIGTKYKDGMSTAQFSIAGERVKLQHDMFYWHLQSNVTNIITPIKSMQSERGKLLKEEIFLSDNASTPAQVKTNTYDTSRTLTSDWLPTYLVRQLGYAEVNTDNYKKIQEQKIEHFSNNDVNTYTNIGYNFYGQVTTRSTTDSNGEDKITSYVYHDRGNYTDPVLKAMRTHHIYDMPLEIHIQRVYVSGGRVIFDNLHGSRYSYCLPNSSNTAIIRPSKIEKYDNVKDMWYTEMEYGNYDQQGNLLESRDGNGMYTCYVWGYGGQYLVGKIENLTLAALKSAVSSLSGISTAPLAGGIQDNVRTTLKVSYPKAQVTLYDYIPFVGLSKITDPSGKITTYQYNGTGKLNTIKDNSGYNKNTYLYSPDNKL